MLTRENVAIIAEEKIKYIKDFVEKSGCKGVILGESGGKDSAVVTALAVEALGSENVLGVNMPCGSLGIDYEDAKRVATAFNIQMDTVDLTDIYNALNTKLGGLKDELAKSNIKPRLRMTTLYAKAQELNLLVIGTDNLSEITIGYFTKWGDGAYDFNPIKDLTVREVLILGEYLGVPTEVLNKKPSAGLVDSQDDESDFGFSYRSLDDYILFGKTNNEDMLKIEKRIKATKHKRSLPMI